MSKPIEGCPQPEAEIRERAYTPEQLERHAKHCDAVEEHDAARMLRTFAATLRQPTNPHGIGSKLVQGEQAGGVDEAMVDRYLAAQKETIFRLDRQWGTNAGGSNFVREACKAGLQAALAQNAQAVDVGAVRRVIDGLNGYCEASDDSCYGTLATSLVRDYTDQLARALSNEKAGPVDGEVLVAIERGEGYEDVHPDLVAEDCMGNATERGWRWRVVSASPAPDKEGL